MNPLINLKNLRITLRGKEIIQNASFSIGEGESLALLGPSGSGKSTIGLALMDLLPEGSVSGQIEFHGKNIALLLQQVQNALNPTRRVGEQLIERVLFHKLMGREEAIAELVNSLKFVGIADANSRLNDYPHQFSGGEKQRLLLAEALLSKPSLLILDEPTSALDVKSKEQLIDLLKTVQKTLSLSLLIITHEIELVEALANRVVRLNNGVIEGSEVVTKRIKKETPLPIALPLEKKASGHAGRHREKIPKPSRPFDTIDDSLRK